MRKQKTLLYASFATLLIIALAYLWGYRFSLSQLNAELNRKLDFGTTTIIYNNSAKDSAIVVSQNDQWIICRQIDKSFGFLWKFNNAALDTIQIDPQSAQFTQTLNAYIIACETAHLPKTLTADNQQLNYSMKNYFNQEAIGSAKGARFEVKIIRLIKALVIDPEPIKVYYYDLVIAPITNQLPVQLKNVIVSPTGKAKDYFKNKTGTGYMTPDDMKDFVKMATFNTWDSIAELRAYEYTLRYSNLSDAVQDQRQLSTSDLDEGMTTLDVTIYFNNTHETIRVSLKEELLTISDKADPALDFDPNFKAIFDADQKSSLGFMPFVSIKPKQEIAR